MSDTIKTGTILIKEGPLLPEANSSARRADRKVSLRACLRTDRVGQRRKHP